MGNKTEKQAVVVTLLFCVGIFLVILLLLCATRLLLVRQPPVQGLAILATQAPPENEGPLSTQQVVARVAPSVVSVDLYDESGITVTGSGSGIILTKDGYIATNAHVVHEAASVRVVLHDGRSYQAKRVGQNVGSDLAVLKIDGKELSAASFGNSEDVAVGQQVLAIGNATGSLPGTPSQGILSGVGRRMPLNTTLGEVVHMNLLQTDAAINPGSSGGALADAHGRIIGICIGKIEETNVENVGFAIPINDALPLLEQIIAESQRSSSLPLV